MTSRGIGHSIWLWAVLTVFASVAQAEDFLSLDDFLRQAFAQKPPELETIWLDQALQQSCMKALGVVPFGLRLHFWRAGSRTAWVMDEIGKERPITFGVVVESDHIAGMQVMSFRESRGGEIRHPFFINQFRGIELQEDGNLSSHVDGITGATLSVAASQRAARLALWLHHRVVDRDASR